MTEVMSVEQDDSLYWAAGSEFVQVLIDGLNNALKESGIADAKQRQGICSNFAFGIGNFLDQYWMEVEGQKRYPVLCFTNEFLDIGVPITEVEPLYLPVKILSFMGRRLM